MAHPLGAPAPTPDADESAPLDLHDLYIHQEARSAYEVAKAIYHEGYVA